MDSRVRWIWHFRGPRPFRPTRSLPFVGPMVIGALIGLALGAAVAWLVARARNAAETAALRAELTHERALAERTEQELTHRFDALAADALRKNNESFLEL